MEKTQELLKINSEKALLDPSPTESPGCKWLILLIILLAEPMPSLTPINNNHNCSSLSSGDF